MSLSKIPHSVTQLPTSEEHLKNHSAQTISATEEEKQLIENFLLECDETFSPETSLKLAHALKGRINTLPKKESSTQQVSFLGKVFTTIKTLITGKPSMSFKDLAEKVAEFANPTLSSTRQSTDNSKKIQKLASTILPFIQSLAEEEMSSLKGKITPPPTSASKTPTP